MKKALFIVLFVFILFALTSCKDPQNAKAGDPVLKNIDFKAYNSFAVMREAEKAKSLSDSIISNANRLFGLADAKLEKITISDEKGVEWACNSVKNVSGKYLLVSLSHANQRKNYCIDRASNAILDLSFLLTDFNGANIQVTAEGLFAKKNENAFKVDIDTKTLIPLTNPETDGAQGFYRDDAGNMLVLTHLGKFKLFPANGAPIECSGDEVWLFSSGVSDKNPFYMIANPSADIILSLADKKIYHISSGALTYEYLPFSKGGNEPYYYGYGSCLFPNDNATISKKIIWYSKTGFVSIHDLSSGSLEFTKFNAPEDLTGTMAYDNGVFYYSTNVEISALELETQVTTTVFEGSVSNWKMAPGGIIYTEYLSATDTQTCFYNFATKEVEKLTSSGVEVISIASFVQ